MGPDDGPVLQLAHLPDPVEQQIGPFGALLCLYDRLVLGKGLQLFHGDKVVHHESKEPLEGIDVAIVLGDLVQIKVPVVGR